MMERNADLSTALRFGRDDKGEGCRFPLDRLMMQRNADLSTALRFGRDDKGEVCRFPLDRLMMERNADLSTALRFGRDDKGEVCRFPQHRLLGREPQISPLRFASVEMTKGRFVAFLNIDCWGRTADPSTALRFRRDDKGKGCGFLQKLRLGCVDSRGRPVVSPVVGVGAVCYS